MEFQKEGIEEELKKITIDNIVEIIGAACGNVFKCTVCGGTSFSFIVDSEDKTLLTPFYTPSLVDGNTDEHCVHYKMHCNTCANEINFNAFAVIERLKELKNELQQED
ncbi:TPA: hypothetical protein RG711_003315 [Morganella morganii subsp. morganii]|nr:hypothetical protein [Morganella morganii subsp. morganii]